MQDVGKCGGQNLISKREFENNTQEVGENGDWLGTLDFDTITDIGENIGDWPMSSEWNFDNTAYVGELRGIEVIAQPENHQEQQESEIIISMTKQKVEH